MNQNFIEKVIKRNLHQLSKTRQQVITPDQIPEIYPQRPSTDQYLVKIYSGENENEINRNPSSSNKFDQSHLGKNPNEAIDTDQRIAKKEDAVGLQSVEQNKTRKTIRKTSNQDFVQYEVAPVRSEIHEIKNNQKEAIISKNGINKINLKLADSINDFTEPTSVHVSDKKEIQTEKRQISLKTPEKTFTNSKIIEKNNITENNTLLKDNGSNEIKEEIQYSEVPIIKKIEKIETAVPNFQPDSELETEKKVVKENKLYEPSKYMQFNYFIAPRKRESDKQFKVESEPVINVKIGKIEVNVIKPLEAKSEEEIKPSLSLDKYLEERERGVR